MSEVITNNRFSNGLKVDVLGARLRRERLGRRLSLEELARKAKVSPSMISEVERGAKVPSILVLDRMATALDTSIARLLDEERAARVVVTRGAEQKVAKDPSGWERRILSPVLPGIEFEFMRTTIGPRVDAGAFSPHAPGSREYLAMERGKLVLTIDGAEHELHAGDSIFYAGDCVHAYRNPSSRPCVYYLAMDLTPNWTSFHAGGRRQSVKEKRSHGVH